MTLVMQLNAATVVANTILLTVLTALYGRLWWKMRTGFSFGLLAFAAILLAQQALQLYFFATMMSLYAGSVETLVLVQNVLTLAAVTFVVAVTWKPGGLRDRSTAPQEA